MISQNISFPHLSTEPPIPTQLLHRIPPQRFSKIPTKLSNMQIPLKSIKQQPKCIRNLKVSPPSAQNFWESLFIFQQRTTEIDRLKKTAEFMQKTKILTTLSLSLNTITSFDLAYGLSQLQYLQNISTLDITICMANHLNSSNIKIFYHSLASLKNLNRLSIELPELSEKSLELIDSLCFALKRIPSTAHLLMKFNSPWDFGDSHIKRLTHHLKKLPKLQTLALNLNKSTEVTNIGLQPLSEILKNLPLLSDFSLHLLNLQGCSASTFHDLFSGLATSKVLKKLDIFITPDSGCNLRSAEPLSSGINLLNPFPLCEITLRLYKDFNDYGMTQLTKALSRFSTLKVLSIEFPHNSSISENGLLELSSALQLLKSLSILALVSLQSCQASQAQNLPPQNLGFQRPPFGFSHISMQNDNLSRPIDVISSGITSLTSLKNLSLDLAGCFGESKTTMQTFSASLQNLKTLKRLKITLAVCKFLEDADLALLTQGLEMLKNLKCLEIDVRHIQTLTNEGIMKLISSFNKLPKLDHLTLKLGLNNTDSSIPEILAQGFKNLTALSSLDLDFSNVKRSSENQEFGILCDCLKNLVSLRKIALELEFTKHAGEKVKELEKTKHVTVNWR